MILFHCISPFSYHISPSTNEARGNNELTSCGTGNVFPLRVYISKSKIVSEMINYKYKQRKINKKSTYCNHMIRIQLMRVRVPTTSNAIVFLTHPPDMHEQSCPPPRSNTLLLLYLCSLLSPLPSCCLTVYLLLPPFCHTSYYSL